jgi:hypothetical protein
MKDWNTLVVGDPPAEVPDGDGTAQVRRDEPGLFVILRHFDGAWQRTAWVRQIGTDWSVNRPEHNRGEVTEDLSSGVESGIILSREALKTDQQESSR